MSDVLENNRTEVMHSQARVSAMLQRRNLQRTHMPRRMQADTGPAVLLGGHFVIDCTESCQFVKMTIFPFQCMPKCEVSFE